MVRAIGWPAAQHETPVAIPAIDVAMIIDFEPDARVTERGAAGNIACSVAANAGSWGEYGFGRLVHAVRLASPRMNFHPCTRPSGLYAARFLPQERGA